MGHIHIGYNNPNEEISKKIIKAMDLFLGVPSIILDTDTQRRTMYGKAGAYRLKDYGVEYRVLSNFWITDKLLVKWAFDNTLKAIEFALNNEIIDEELIVNCINNSDKELAFELTNKYKLDILEKEIVKI